MHRAIAVLALVACLAACSGQGTGAESPDHGSRAPQPEQPVGPDAALRPVAMPTGNGLAFVRPETAAQALCHALTPQEWADVAGGRVGRSVDEAICRVDAPLVSIALGMSDLYAWEAVEPVRATELAGFDVRVDEDGATAVVAVEPEIIGEIYSTTAKPVLRVSATSRAGADPVPPARAVESLLPVLLPRLSPPGPSVPIGPTTALRPTRPPEGVALIDMTAFTAGSVVCTLIAEELGGPVERASVSPAYGSCRVDHLRVTPFIAEADDLEAPVESIAGFRAHAVEESVEGATWNRITIELAAPPALRRPVTLTIRASGRFDPRALAEHVLTSVAVA